MKYVLFQIKSALNLESAGSGNCCWFKSNSIPSSFNCERVGHTLGDFTIALQKDYASAGTGPGIDNSVPLLQRHSGLNTIRGTGNHCFTISSCPRKGQSGVDLKEPRLNLRFSGRGTDSQ